MLNFAFYESQFGLIKIGYENGEICSIKTAEIIDCENEPSVLTEEAFKQLEEFFKKERKTFDLPLKIKGTPFQEKVWRALMEIPYGEMRTYGEIAEKIGCPKGARAVGSANHNNPLWIVVPCHRVVGKDGKLTGYAGGTEMKKTLLRLEQE
ncbi:MAG: methylated-DNA--[Clostridia bacterium]|nr:methylated-DNA--[protein]-cysteine S-methyltransferase [Clostridia bacterium]